MIADLLHVGNPREPGPFNQVGIFDVGHGPRPGPMFRRAVACREPFTVRLEPSPGR